MESVQVAFLGGGACWSVLAVAFDFMNGFHDAANSIATVVSTGVLKPQQAVAVRGLLQRASRSLVFHSTWRPRSARASSQPGIVDHHVVFGALIGAHHVERDHLAYGIPSSSSHALIGGIVGAVIAKSGIGALIGAGVLKVGGLHLRLAAAGVPAGLAADGGGGLGCSAQLAAAGGQLVPPAAAGLGRPVQPGPWRQ